MNAQEPAFQPPPKTCIISDSHMCTILDVLLILRLACLILSESSRRSGGAVLWSRARVQFAVESLGMLLVDLHNARLYYADVCSVSYNSTTKTSISFLFTVRIPGVYRAFRLHSHCWVTILLEF